MQRSFTPTLRLALIACIVVLSALAFAHANPIALGSRLELFLDDHLIERITGADLRLHPPERREVVLVTDKPWEGNACAYRTVFQDGGKIRMYYAGNHYDLSVKGLKAHPSYLCYAESRDGIHWERPNLNLVEYQGSRQNNIVLAEDTVKIPGLDKLGVDHFSVYKDPNPDRRPGEDYKMLVLGRRALYALASSDGFRWKPIRNEPVITKGYFDSKNLAFWDPVARLYRAYFRDFRNTVTGAARSQQARQDDGHRYVRDIMTATSTDFIHWSEPRWLDYPGVPDEELYTNQIVPYYRAPHFLVGFPMRYQDRGWSEPMRMLPNLEHRQGRSQISARYGTAVTDALFMSSRDGLRFNRSAEAFIRPGPLQNNWVYGDNNPAWGLIETASAIAGAPNELSLYAVENYWRGNAMQLRRFALRIDGFVSVSAPARGGEFVTRPLTFEGNQLQLNFSTSAAGSVRIEIQDERGQPVPGFSLAENPELFGDAIEYAVPWKRGSKLEELAGRTIRLRFVLKDADLYSFRFKKMQ